MCSFVEPFIVLGLFAAGIVAGILIAALVYALTRYINRRTLASADLRRAVVDEIDRTHGTDSTGAHAGRARVL